MIRLGLGLVVIASAVNGLSAEPPKLALKSEKLDLPKGVAEGLRSEFGTAAFSISDGDAAAMTIWPRTVIPAKATAEQVENGLTYREIPEGTLVAVVTLERAFVDYRKQRIAAGTYTLRLAVQPDTGDHRDTAPHTDFLLLTPAAEDKSPEAAEVKDLVKRSLKATGGDHPGVMLLYPHFGKGADAMLADKGDGVRCLQWKGAVKAGETETPLGFSLVVAGYSKTR